METTATFYFSTRTLAASDMTPITAPVSDMTTTAANSNNTSIFWHDQHQHLTWPQHQVSILYTRTPAIWHENHSSFYFSTRKLAVSDITPSNSTSLWHDHNSSKFYLSTRTLAFSDMSTTAPASDMTTTSSFYLIYKNTSNLTWKPQQVSTLAQEH